jgi:hypothetical protein
LNGSRLRLTGSRRFPQVCGHCFDSAGVLCLMVVVCYVAAAVCSKTSACMVGAIYVACASKCPTLRLLNLYVVVCSTILPTLEHI